MKLTKAQSSLSSILFDNVHTSIPKISFVEYPFVTFESSKGSKLFVCDARTGNEEEEEKEGHDDDEDEDDDDGPIDRDLKCFELTLADKVD